MARNKLISTCTENSRCVATTSEKEASRISGRVVDTGRVLASDLFVQDEEIDATFDSMMRNNRGVL